MKIIVPFSNTSNNGMQCQTMQYNAMEYNAVIPRDATTSLLELKTLAKLFFVFSCSRKSSSVSERVLYESVVRS